MVQREHLLAVDVPRQPLFREDAPRTNRYCRHVDYAPPRGGGCVRSAAGEGRRKVSGLLPRALVRCGRNAYPLTELPSDFSSALDKSIRRSPDFSSFESAANMASVHRDAGRMDTVMLMHFHAMRSSVQKEISSAARAVLRRLCSVTILSVGTRTDVVSESYSIPRHRCTLVGRRSHFFGNKK